MPSPLHLHLHLLQGLRESELRRALERHLPAMAMAFQRAGTADKVRALMMCAVVQVSKASHA